MSEKSVTLKRSLSLGLIFAYGLGTILGAGIYVLVGKVAGFAGVFAPIAFLLAALVATFTALSYSELASRHPKAAGEATYVYEAFGQKWLSCVIGWMVVITGVISAGAMARGFIGYFHYFVPLPSWLIITCLIAFLGLIAIWGVCQSVIIATVVTLVEIGGLILVLAISGRYLTFHPPASVAFSFPTSGEWWGIVLGAFLAFYAFIGFEDIVNLAEEVKKPRRNLPLAIILSIIVATVLYVLIAFAAILVVPIEALKESDAPFVLLFEQQGFPPGIISAISLVAIINSALIQMIMASRVLYGMGKAKTAPTFFAHVHKWTRTPIWGTLCVALIVWLFALIFPSVLLAQATSFFILIVFAFVNCALIRLKFKPCRLPNIYSVPMVIPLLGFILSLGLLVLRVGLI